MNDEIIHVAGPLVDMNKRFIQRCAVCGLKLVDMSSKESLLLEDGMADLVRIRHFVPGRLISEKDGEFTVAPFGEDQTVPENSCINLVE